VQAGHVVQGRISEIKCSGELRFSCTLKCKKEDLQNHKEYLDKTLADKIPEEDLKNHNFLIEKKQ